MMRVVYFESGVAADDDLDRELRAGGDADWVAVATDDAAWPPSSPVLPVRLPSARSAAFRDLLTQVLSESIRFAGGGAGALVCRGIDVAEAASFEWFHEVAVPLHRAWALARLLAAWSPDELVWVRPAGAGADAAFAARVATVAGGHGTRARVVAADGHAHAPARPVRRVAAGAREIAGDLRLRRVRHPAMAPGGCLLVERYANHVADLLPSVEGLGGVRLVSSDPAAVGRASGAVPSTLLASSVGRRAVLRAGASRARLARRVPQFVATAWESVLRTIGPAATVAEADFRRAGTACLLRAAYAVALADALVTASRPSVVASTANAPITNRAVVLAARRAGVESVFVQHGLITTWDYRELLVFDHYLVWGARDRDRLVQGMGVDPRRVTVTGWPRLERLRRAAAESTTAVPARPFTVAYLASRSGGSFVGLDVAARMLDAVVEAVGSLDGARLVVKVHPADASGVFDRVEGWPRVEVIRSGDARDVIAGADAVVAATSTAGFEACALDRALVLLAFDGVEVPDAYGEYGSALVASNARGLADCLARIADGGPVATSLAEGRHRMAAGMFASFEPGAAARAAAVLRDLATKPRSQAPDKERSDGRRLQHGRREPPGSLD